MALAGALTVMSVGLVVAYYGLEAVSRMRPGEIDAVEYVTNHAPNGSILMIASPNAPMRANANYDHLQLPAGEMDPNLLNDPQFINHEYDPHDPNSIRRFLEQWAPRATDGFILLTTGQQAYLDLYRLGPPDAVAHLDELLGRSSDWKPYFRNADAVVYEINGWSPPQ
jgi:hypothetical protein